MKTKSCFFALVLLALTMSACASAEKEPSASEGQRLFNDPKLSGSTNASSCATCHPGGKGLEKAADNPKLVSVINACIVGHLEGRRVQEDSVEMLSLKIYVESLGGK